jgi:hypothetical protein
MTPPVNRTGSLGRFKRPPASRAITAAAAHPATRSSSRAHTPAIMAGLKRLAPFNHARPPVEIARLIGCLIQRAHLSPPEIKSGHIGGAIRPRLAGPKYDRQSGRRGETAPLKLHTEVFTDAAMSGRTNREM